MGYVTLKEAASRYGVKESIIKKQVEKGKLKAMGDGKTMTISDEGMPDEDYSMIHTSERAINMMAWILEADKQKPIDDGIVIYRQGQEVHTSDFRQIQSIPLSEFLSGMSKALKENRE